MPGDPEMNDADITWGEMWAEEEQQRQAAVDAGWPGDSSREGPGSAVLGAELYFDFGEPHHREPQPYFELHAGPSVDSDPAQPPALRVELKAQPVSAPERDTGHPVERVDWQAPPPSTPVDEDEPSRQDREWGSTWADGIYRED